MTGSWKFQAAVTRLRAKSWELRARVNVPSQSFGHLTLSYFVVRLFTASGQTFTLLHYTFLHTFQHIQTRVCLYMYAVAFALINFVWRRLAKPLPYLWLPWRPFWEWQRERQQRVRATALLWAWLWDWGVYWHWDWEIGTQDLTQAVGPLFVSSWNVANNLSNKICTWNTRNYGNNILHCTLHVECIFIQFSKISPTVFSFSLFPSSLSSLAFVIKCGREMNSQVSGTWNVAQLRQRI